MNNYNEVSFEIYTALTNKIETTGLVGNTVFNLGDITINVESKDGIGGLIQEWVGIWASNQGYNIRTSDTSQEFPDYFVDLNDFNLEIKSFNYNAGANFDIANFESYCTSLANDPNRINSDYLIFGYTIEGHSLSIRKVWLKKIWEITGPSGRWPLKTQTKRNVIYNIRPISWDSNSSTYPAFNDPSLFIDALYTTQEQYLGASHRQLYLDNFNNQ